MFGRALLFVALLLSAAPALAQSAPSSDAGPDAASSIGAGPSEKILGPPAPEPPEVVSRDDKGNVTLRTMRLPSPITVDGALDELFYSTVPAASGFIQQEPQEGTPATDKTEVWVFYDDKNLYVAARLWESETGHRVTSDMRRDSQNMYNNDHFAVLLDTFYDHRNGFGFSSNAVGGMFDWAVTNEQPNNNWNQIWFANTADFENGWTLEMTVPFRSLRIREDGTLWGINFRRMVRWKNEVTYLNPVPRSWGRRGLSKVSSAATLVGLQRPGKTLNLDVKPYVLGSNQTNRRVSPAIEGDNNGEWGVDAKWGITQTLIADYTYNTDFAQVEDDEQQVNLTRFSLFFPERREFFLEGQDVFSFAGAGAGGGGGNQPGGGGGGGGGGLNNQNAPILFFSRRIGLDAGQVVPIFMGGRLLGRQGPWNIGALNMSTEDVPGIGNASTNFSVLRLTRDVLARSRVGIIGTARNPSGVTGATANAYTAGADAVFNLYDNVQVVSYYARTDTPGRTGDQASYRGAYAWNADRWGLQADYMKVGEDFNPEVGFMRRTAFKRSFGQFRFSPRPAQPSPIRKHTYEASLDYITGPGSKLETREAQGTYRMELNNGDQLNVDVTRSFEGLTEDFTPATGVTIPVGNYSFSQLRANYNFGQQRRVNGGLTAAYGGYFDGTLTELTWRGRVEPAATFLIEPTYSWNRVTTPFGDFTTQLAIARVTWTMSPRRFASALIQYQSATNAITTNARFRWEYTPGSELFVVYTDGRNTLSRGFPSMDNRSFIIKVTRLLRW